MNKKGVKRTAITPGLIENVVRDFHEKEMTPSEIAKKYKVNYRTARRLTEQYEYGYSAEKQKPIIKEKIRIIDCTIQTDPITIERRKLTESQRAEALVNDAIEVTELTLQAMKNKLSSQPDLLPAKDLASFMAAAAPYIMPKAGGKGKKGDHKENPRDELIKILKGNAKTNTFQRN